MPTAKIYKKLYRLFFALGLFIGSMFVGVEGYRLTEGYETRDAFFMTTMIISTTGMNEVQKLSPEGRLFTSFYVIFNLVIFGYFVSVATSYIFEGGLKDAFRNYMNTRVANKMKDHTIVCGYGRNGSKACEELFRSGMQFAIIEKGEEKLQEAIALYENKKNIYILQGDATSDEILIDAGVKKAKTIITTLGEDADNVFVTLTARELNPHIKIIAKAVKESSVSKLMRAGAHHVVVPEIIGGTHMASLVTKPDVIEFLNMLNGIGHTELRLEELRVSEMKEEYIGKTIKELGVREITGANIIAYKDMDGFMFNPTPETTFDTGGVLIVLGTENELRTFVSYFSKW
jgi:voltage-gated potassium channel